MFWAVGHSYASSQITETRVSPVAIPSDIKIHLSDYNRDRKIGAPHKIKFFLANSPRTNECRKLSVHWIRGNARRNSPFRGGVAWFWSLNLKPSVRLLQRVCSVEYGKRSTRSNSRGLPIINPAKLDYDLLTGDELLYLDMGGHNIWPLVLRELTPRFVHLITHCMPLKEGSYYSTDRNEEQRSSEVNHPFFIGADPLPKTFKVIYIGFVATAAYALCLCATWMIHQKWNIRALLTGLLLYALAAVLIFHGITIL
jgi:hypothetical protein